MTSAKLFPLAALAVLALAACEARFGNDSGQSNGSAEGKSKEGELSVSANGFEMKIRIPEGLRREADSGTIAASSIRGSRRAASMSKAAATAAGRARASFASRPPTRRTRSSAGIAIRREPPPSPWLERRARAKAW